MSRDELDPYYVGRYPPREVRLRYTDPGTVEDLDGASAPREDSSRHSAPEAIFTELREIAHYIERVFPESAADLREDAQRLQEQHGFLERDLAFVRANTDSIRDYNEKLTKEVTRLREQLEAARLGLDAADRLEYEVRYFDDHTPDECAVIRAADAYCVARGREASTPAGGIPEVSSPARASDG